MDDAHQIGFKGDLSSVDIFKSENLIYLLDNWNNDDVWTPQVTAKVKEDIFHALTDEQKRALGVTSADQLGIARDHALRNKLHIGNKATGTNSLTLDNGRISTRTIFPMSGESIGRLLAEHTGIQPYHSSALDKPSLAAEDLFDSNQYRKDFDDIVAHLEALNTAQLTRLVDLVYDYFTIHKEDMRLCRVGKSLIHLNKGTHAGHPALITNIPVQGTENTLWIFNSGSKA